MTVRYCTVCQERSDAGSQTMGRVPMVVPDLSLCNITYTNSIEVGDISVTVYSMYTVYLYINYCNYLCLNTTLYK